MEFLIQINIELRVTLGTDHHTEDEQAMHLEHHFDLQVLLFH